MKKRAKSVTKRELQAHDEAAQIERGIQRCLSLLMPWSGDLFRFSNIVFANRRDVATGEGSRLFGGRFTPPGVFRAIYGGLDPETALAEKLAESRRDGLPDARALPAVLVALEVHLDRVLDLTDGQVRSALGVTEHRLLAPWRRAQLYGREAYSQAVGRLARAAGVQAILYRSAQRPSGKNLVAFPELLLPGQLTLVNEDLLPRRRARRRRT